VEQHDPDVVAAALTALAKSGAAEPEHAQARVSDPAGERSEPAQAAHEPFRYPSLLGELQANADQIAAVAQATRTLARAGEPNAARAVVCTAALDFTGAAAAALFELGDDGGLVETARAGAGASARVGASRLPPLLAEGRSCRMHRTARCRLAASCATSARSARGSSR
jgi:hypothetical protein